MKNFILFKKIGLALLFLQLSSTFTFAQQVYINEFLASNSNVNVDEFGENDDWIELYNSSSSPVNIGGYFLTDDLINTTKWSIPAGTTIPGNGFLLFWCDNQDIQGPNHTNFKLSSGGESVALVASDGTTIIDSYIYGPQTANTSFGRSTDGGTTWVFFGTPTPEASNGGGSTVAVMPVATYEGGHYTNDILVELSTTTSGATIRYTLDGSDPTASSTIYNNALAVDETTVLRARTFKSGMDPSRTMTHTYMYGISHTMPIFCVSTDDDNFFGDDGIYTNWDDDIEVPCHVEFFETDGTFGFRQDLGVQVHGGFSQSYPHKGISFVAKNQYGNNKINYPLFPDLPFDEYGSFILRASGNDWSKALFRDALATSLVKNLDEVDPMIKDPDLEFQGYRPAIVYLNGEYFGIHNLREKLDWRYLKTHYGIEKEDADIVEKKNSLEHGNLDAWTEYRDLVEDGDFTDSVDYAAIQTWMDLDHYIDYFLHQVFIDNNDWPDNNNKGWRLREEGNTWRYFLYDQDRCFGLIPLSGDYNSGDFDAESLEMVLAETQTEDHNKEWSTLMLRKLMENEEFKIKFINRMADFLNILYTPERMLTKIDEFEAVYEVEIDQHADKWWDTNYYGTNIDRARIFANGRTEEMWNQYDEYYDEITAVVDLDLNASPQAGGVIHLNTMNFREENFPWTGQYFAGVDVPLRAAPNPGYFFTGWTPSSLGNDPVTTMNLTGNGNIVANFSLGSTQIGNIVINEINYHSPDTCDAGDWIELFNYGTETVDVSGWFLEDEKGNYFNIPPNTFIGGEGFLVLVEDEARFNTVHPTVTNYVAGFGNSITGSMGLSNGGEWISINNADRSFIDTVHYDDQLPWPEAPDGNGPSLQLIDHLMDNALPGSWTPSAEPKGTPGSPHAQGVLYIGENSTLCVPTNITLDATYSPCFGCTYLWNDGSTNSTLEVIPAEGENIYSVTVTDNFGTVQEDEITIELSPSFDLSYTDQDLICNSATNGSVDLSVNGPGTFTYQWTNGATTQDLNNIGFGIYTVTVTNGLFCTQTESIAITSPPALIPSAVETGIDCNGDLASIDLSVSGGTFPYTYAWSTGATTQDEANLTAGNYAVTVTDMNACTEVMNFNYTEPLALAGSFDVEHACGGLAVGTIDVDMEGGSGGYSYTWSNGSSGSSDDLENLNAGLYTLTVSDAQNCTWVETTEVLASSPMAGNETINDLPCMNSGVGSISLNMTGGNSPYNFAWSNNATTPNNQNLSQGGYWVTVTDATGCEYTDSLTVSSPDAVTAQAQINDISCFGAADAAININATGGSGTYTYVWNNGETTASIANLAVGNFAVTITDSNGCSSDYEYTLDQPTMLSAIVQTEAIACFGENNGALSVNANGGTGNPVYAWSNGSTATELSNIATGSYTVTATDANGCTTTETVTLPENPQIIINISQTNLNCNSTPTGSISLNTSGGQEPYHFLWNTDETTASLNNLAAATYSVTVTDDNNCTTIENIIITQPDPVLLNSSQTNIACSNGNDGTVSLFPSGGAEPYSYTWNNGAFENELTNLSIGTYEVTVSDNNSCTFSESFTLTEPSLIEISAEVETVSCFGENNGAIAVDVEGGIGSYQYSWSNGGNESSINQLVQGNYTLTVVDQNDCIQTETVTVTQPSEMQVPYSTFSPTCAGFDDGSASVDVSGGIAPYTYSWNTGVNEVHIDNLTADTYSIIVTDNNGCTQEEFVEITEPAPVGYTGFQLTDNNCFGGNNGFISLNATGGVGNYSYNWNTGAAENAIDLLTAGEYSVTITDANDCSYTDHFEITEPLDILLASDITNASCFEGNDGVIELNTSGGTGAFQILWNNGATNTQLENLPQGEYFVTVTDELACTAVESFVVDHPLPLIPSISSTPVVCNGASDAALSISASGGTAPFTYEWENGNTTASLSNLSAGNYSYTITDANNCVLSDVATLVDPPVLEATYEQINNECFADSTGSLMANIAGGVLPYAYNWSNGDNNAFTTNLAAAEYTLTLTDANGCSFEESFTITEAPMVNIISSIEQISCNGADDATISVDVSGGTPGYSIVWSNGSVEDSISELSSGAYSLTITDAADCPSTVSYLINEPELLEVAETIEEPQNGGGGMITITPSGGTAPYDITWDNGATDFELSSLTGGVYNYAVTDANGCLVEGTISLIDVSIEKLAKGALKIYPNPTYGLVNIEGDFKAMEVSVIDLLGRTVQHFAKAGTASIWTVELGDLADGVYFLKVETEKGLWVERVVVE